MTDWNGRSVLILGAARQGLALARYLAPRGARVILNDRRAEDDLHAERRAMEGAPGEVRWITGGHPLEALDGVDLVCVSGGVPLNLPLLLEAARRGIPLSNDTQIFLEAALCKVIGITGSAGKTTTTTLVGRMALNALGERAWVGGNIGLPLLAELDAIRGDHLVVLELSSFQLELTTRSPQVAAALNVTPNHLDRHGTMAAYTAAKARILAFQGGGDWAVLGRDDPGSWGLAAQARGRLAAFGMDDCGLACCAFRRGAALILRWDGVETEIMPRAWVELRGEHNLLNALAACAIAAAAGLPVEAMRAGVQGFRGVAHRLEFVRTWGGADWYNDSIATAPERAMAAMRSFDAPLVLLAGGRDKDLPWEDFAALVKARAARLVLFGEAAEKIARVLGAAVAYTRCANLGEAVQAAARIVQPGDVVLLSPGGTSFDEFKDFEERGECFKQLVMRL
ncbi:MAG: UDP-N-acetylmuramoyl-L-alanine--D-glutamate ligase [Chloroflexi bacterium]|nr:UDP-N-acetylmuramoyl-L-alanine--D-glutamate ligase [Chloroflexota bacterium]